MTIQQMAEEYYPLRFAPEGMEFPMYTIEDVIRREQAAFTAGFNKAREWMDISTAPKDGTKIDLFFSYGRKVSCWYDEGYWVQRMGANELLILKDLPTHWMPLPSLPSPPVK